MFPDVFLTHRYVKRQVELLKAHAGGDLYKKQHGMMIDAIFDKEVMLHLPWKRANSTKDLRNELCAAENIVALFLAAMPYEPAHEPGPDSNSKHKIKHFTEVPK